MKTALIITIVLAILIIGLLITWVWISRCKLKKLDKDNLDHLTTIDQLKDDLHKQDIEITKQNTENTKLTTTIQLLSHEKEAAENSFIELKKSSGNYEALLKEHEALKAANGEVNSLVMKATERRNEIEVIQANIDAKNKEIKQKEDAIKQLDAHYKKREEDLENHFKAESNRCDDIFKTRSADYDQRIKTLEERTKQADEELVQRQNDLKAKTSELASVVDAIHEKERSCEAMEASMKDFAAQLEELKQALVDCQAQYDTAANIAAMVADEKKRAEDSDGKVVVDSSSLRAIEYLEEVKQHIKDEGVASLSELLIPTINKALWDVFWQKAIAKGVGEPYSGVSGIYCLVSVADRRVAYVGQAVDIKKRWVEHAKKMLGGVGSEMPKGELLYEKITRPDQVRWTVLEKWNGKGDRTKWLNDREAYYIGYLHCTEVGLNSKKGTKSK